GNIPSTLYPLTSSPSHLSIIAEEPPINYSSRRYDAFEATAYSLRGRTASGNQTRKGIIAADRNVLPLGSRVHVQAGNYTGEYIVSDTGGAVRGRKLDIWVPSSREAMQFGRRKVKLTVLEYPVRPMN
ncbi:MAG: 3D domain-containing protein, partial [Pyrinomonadaceae bacterium]